MFATARIASSHVARANVVPRAVAAIGSTRSMAVGGNFASKVSRSLLRARIRVRLRISRINFGNATSKNTISPPFLLSQYTTKLPQEKVEEERYIRARERELAEARAKAASADAKAKELEKKSAELVAKKTAAMNEVADMLAQTGDVVSEAGLANLADWKYGS